MENNEITIAAGGNVKWRFPQVHPEGVKFGLIAAAITGVFFLMGWEVVGWLMLIVTMWVLAFFRDPVRAVPQDEGAIIAPADGLVTLIQKVPPPRDQTRNLSEADPQPVVPLDQYMLAFIILARLVQVSVQELARNIDHRLDRPADRRAIDMDVEHAHEDGHADQRLIAKTRRPGHLARRIVPFVKPGDMVAAGQRIGLIRFGSRVDVYLPAGTAPRVILGQRTVAGETILGQVGDRRVIAGIQQ